MPSARHRPLGRRALLSVGLVSAVGLTAAACSDPTAATDAAPVDGASAPAGATATADATAAPALNTSPDQDRIRAEANPDLAAAVPAEIAETGVLRLATMGAGGAPPLVFVADDNRTPIGSETDMAQLVADKLGLQLDITVVSWDAWPLKLESNEVDLVNINIGVTPERQRKYDFATYRAALVGFGAKTGSGLAIDGPEDVEGLNVSAGGGTTQEGILLRWNEILESEGRTPATIHYYANDADTLLALGAGRLDAYAGPNPGVLYTAATRDDVEIVGTVAEAWPDDTLIGFPTRAGTGLADVLSAALDELIAEGLYGQVLARWGLEGEALEDSQVFTADDPEGRDAIL